MMQYINVSINHSRLTSKEAASLPVGMRHLHAVQNGRNGTRKGIKNTVSLSSSQSRKRSEPEHSELEYDSSKLTTLLNGLSVGVFSDAARLIISALYHSKERLSKKVLSSLRKDEGVTSIHNVLSDLLIAGFVVREDRALEGTHNLYELDPTWRSFFQKVTPKSSKRLDLTRFEHMLPLLDKMGNEHMMVWLPHLLQGPLHRSRLIEIMPPPQVAADGSSQLNPRRWFSKQYRSYKNILCVRTENSESNPTIELEKNFRTWFLKMLAELETTLDAVGGAHYRSVQIEQELIGIESDDGVDMSTGLPEELLLDGLYKNFGIDPFMPTSAKPGSEEKITYLAARYAAGVESIWHPGDCYDHGPRSVGNLVVDDFMNGSAADAESEMDESSVLQDEDQ